MPRFPLASVLALSLLVPALAQAAAVGVTVTNEAGQPLADAVVMLEAAGAKPPVKPMPTVEVSQAKRQFNPRVTVVTVGTAVSFPNFDTVRHHVYSFSPIKTFELKLYAGVPASPIVFDKPGVAVLGCNIHDRMAAWVVVVDTPYHARTDAQGHARLEGVPAGPYRLRAWHAGVAPGKEPAPITLNVAAGDAQSRLTLPAAPL
ncbi:methylamine utilization protein [Piscinibacter sp. HJYY11]|uniref:methylamine utilization protein n=1 Tax=Piscinibacter sp. HJYY11 TaxID=2801333 RepID=UPI00191D4A93|nr:methylamine utilization protein [Piscinibacter sp. HJYY11]MBL0728805.1 methylamine utilization protein [Piscinibacter sp. HJYY11]